MFRALGANSDPAALPGYCGESALGMVSYVEEFGSRLADVPEDDLQYLVLQSKNIPIYCALVTETT